MRVLLNIRMLFYAIIGNHSNWELVEIVLGIMALIWGLFILGPAATFLLVSNYSAMIFPEWLWGTVFTLYGIISIVANVKHYHYIRRSNTIIGIIIWFLLGHFNFIGNAATAVGPIWIFISILSLIILISSRYCNVTQDKCGRRYTRRY
jgi:hypothetical protein